MAPKKEKVITTEERDIANEIEIDTIQEDVKTIKDFLEDMVQKVNEEIVKLSKESIDAKRTREKEIKQEAKEWHKVKEYIEDRMKVNKETGLTDIEYWCGMEPKTPIINQVHDKDKGEVLLL